MNRPFRFFILIILSCLLTPPPTIWPETNPSLLSETPSSSYLHLVARKSKSKKAASPTVVKDLRFHHHSDHTRVVLDLKTHVNFTETRKNKSSQATIELKNSVLGKTAKAQLKAKRFPKALRISETRARTVTISLDLGKLVKYNLFTLEKPYRLVLDLYPHFKPPSQETQKVKQATITKKAPPAPVPVQPIKRPQDLLIVLDPGHGGKDPGAIGKKGTKEKNITLDIAKRLRRLIMKRLGAKVVMTREQDRFIELEDRVSFANNKKADVFVSIHVNSHPQKRVRGLELYHFGEASDPRALEVAARENGLPLQKGGPVWQYILADKLNDNKIDESQEFAWTTQKKMTQRLKKHYYLGNHGVKTAPFYVLRFTTMPGLLAEIAFVSNPKDEKLLRNKTYQQRVAEGLFEGIKAYAASATTMTS